MWVLFHPAQTWAGPVRVRGFFFFSCPFLTINSKNLFLKVCVNVRAPPLFEPVKHDVFVSAVRRFHAEWGGDLLFHLHDFPTV